MANRRNSRGRLPGIRLVVGAAFALLAIRHVLLLEEEEEAGDPGSHISTPPEAFENLPKDMQTFLRHLDDRIARRSRLSRKKILRFRAGLLLSTALAAAIPVAVAASSPGWITALLGSLAAFIQAALQVTQDYRIGATQHFAAVRLTEAINSFWTEIIIDPDEPRDAFRTLVNNVNQIDRDSSTRITDIMEEPFKPGETIDE
jgi:ABC-type multidrug transport system fused ATPase/permease subunit